MHEFRDQPEEPLPFLLLRLVGGETLRMLGGVVHHLGEDHRPCRR
jgi:hypothetical protein